MNLLSTNISITVDLRRDHFHGMSPIVLEDCDE